MGVDRIHSAEILLASLDKTDAEIEKIWVKESESRHQAYKEGRVKGTTLRENKKGKIQEKIKMKIEMKSPTEMVISPPEGLTFEEQAMWEYEMIQKMKKFNKLRGEKAEIETEPRENN